MLNPCLKTLSAETFTFQVMFSSAKVSDENENLGKARIKGYDAV
jgi:hypothetical protein